MISEVVMPQMGADMTEGTLIRWLKEEGAEVTRGEIIAEIETDKANVEIEAFESGIFRKALAGEGDVVQVGEVIAVIADRDEDISQYGNGAKPMAAPMPAAAPGEPVESAPQPTAPPAAAMAPAPQQETASPPRSATPPAEQGRIRASPLAKRLANERGLDIARVRGTGPDGRIVKRDIDALDGAAPAAAAPPTPQPAPAHAVAAADAQVSMSRMRQAIARRMSQSKREAPHYYLLVDIDMTAAMTLRSQINDAVDEDARVSINDMIVRACALALQRHPQFNTTIEDDQVTRRGAQHVCIAIALDDGLIAPAILDAGTKTLAEIARDAKDLIFRAKGGRLRPDEMSAGTFTVTNLGPYGVETLIGIIQPPQTAILGAGSVMPQPAVRDGEIVVRQLMKVALSADHRVTDGAQGAQFLAEIKRILEQPVLLLL
jgi:pyruvate dehydrogenase E2 component (dihydrolipoamide acetyltransferase)